MVIWFIIGGFILLCILPAIDGITGKYTFAKLYGVKVETIETTDTDETSEQTEKEELQALNKEERLDIVCLTIRQYNTLIENLEKQYQLETDEKKKAAILRQQVIALEKLNKALEKREKLE